MAAMLIEIKSRMLLPRPPARRAPIEDDPRAELVRRLLEYERMKQAAQALDELPQAGRDFRRSRSGSSRRSRERLPDVSPHDLRRRLARAAAPGAHQPRITASRASSSRCAAT